MIERAHVHVLLRRQWLGYALVASVVACVAPLIAALVLYMLGAGAYGVSGVGVAFLWLLTYGLALTAAVVAAMGAFRLVVVIRAGAQGAGTTTVSPAYILPAFLAVFLGYQLMPLRYRFQPALWNWAADWAGYFWRGGPHLFSAIFLGYHTWAYGWLILTVALAAAMGVVLTIGLLRTEPLFKRVFAKIEYTCPHCACTGRPSFCCSGPGCTQIHDDLRPSIYGILWARCAACQERLPTTDLMGRLRLKKVCANGHDLDDTLGRAGEYHLAVVGATASGKSSLIAAAVWKLKNNFAPHNYLKVKSTSAADEMKYRRWEALFQTGQRVAQTIPGPHLSALPLALTSGRGHAGRVYLYDAAGEHFEGGQARLVGHTYQRHINGLILIIDPFAEQDFRNRLTPEERAAVNPATVDAMEILVQLMPYWENVWRARVGGKLGVPLAVVLTKVDAGGLDQEVKLSEVDGFYVSTAVAAAHAERHSRDVRTCLKENGMGNLVGNVEARFEKVAYFAASALGRQYDPADPSPFQPRGALAPLLWLLYQTDALTERPAPVRWIRNATKFLRRCFQGREGLAAWCVATGLLLLPIAAILLRIARYFR